MGPKQGESNRDIFAELGQLRGGVAGIHVSGSRLECLCVIFGMRLGTSAIHPVDHVIDGSFPPLDELHVFVLEASEDVGYVAEINHAWHAIVHAEFIA